MGLQVKVLTKMEVMMMMKMIYNGTTLNRVAGLRINMSTLVLFAGGGKKRILQTHGATDGRLDEGANVDAQPDRRTARHRQRRQRQRQR